MAETWQILRELGAGGQGDVFLARSPQAVKVRQEAAQALFALIRRPPLREVERDPKVAEVEARDLESLPSLLRIVLADEAPGERGALKRFRIPQNDPERKRALGRFEQEIAALQEHKHPAILKLLAFDLDQHEMVTEYHPLGTLEDKLDRFRGDAGGALAALLPVVQAVETLHKAGVVHRDIKLPNIFLANDGHLVLGDFGIVFYSDAEGTRLTQTYGEKVGSSAWMPSWALRNRRLEDVPASFDVYTLGKVLWCMIAGEPTLPYWFHDEPDFDLEKRFPRQPEMEIVNGILRGCVVKDEANCVGSTELYGAMHEALRQIRRGGVTVREEGFPCRLCARGTCKPLRGPRGKPEFKLPLPRPDVHLDYVQHVMEGSLQVRVFRCDFCHNMEFFHVPPNQELPPGWASK